MLKKIRIIFVLFLYLVSFFSLVYFVQIKSFLENNDNDNDNKNDRSDDSGFLDGDEWDNFDPDDENDDPFSTEQKVYLFLFLWVFFVSYAILSNTEARRKRYIKKKFKRRKEIRHQQNRRY